MITIYHLGPEHPAFLYAEVPRRGDLLDSSLAWLLDGTAPRRGDFLICGTCKQPLGTGDLRIPAPHPD